MNRGVLVTLPLIALTVALAACGGNKSSGGNASHAASSPAPAPALSCNGESPVWVLRGPKVYLVSDDRLYGKTRHGQYLCLSQAQAEGYQPARHPVRHHHHRRQES
jgi:hypothetical protein